MIARGTFLSIILNVWPQLNYGLSPVSDDWFDAVTAKYLDIVTGRVTNVFILSCFRKCFFFAAIILKRERCRPTTVLAVNPVHTYAVWRYAALYDAANMLRSAGAVSAKQQRNRYQLRLVVMD